MKDRKRNLTLPRYYAESPHDPLGRVAPCLDAMVGKLAVVRLCLERVADRMRGDEDEEAVDGAARVISEVEDELYEASRVLRAEKCGR